MVVLDVSEDDLPGVVCADAVEDWHPLDKVLHAKGTVRVTFTFGLREEHEDRRILSSVLQRSDTAGLLCFG